MSFYESQEEARGNLIMQVRDTLNAAEERGGLDAEAEQKISAIEADIEKIDRSLEVAKRQSEREAAAVESARAFAPANETPSEESVEIFRSLAEGSIRSHKFENRATLVPTANTVPTDFLDRVMMKARLTGPFLELAEVFNRTSGQDLRIPVMSGYSTAVEEGAGDALTSSEPTFTSINLSPAKQGFLVPVANELLTDVGFPLEQTIADQAGNAIGTRADTIIYDAIDSVATVGKTADSATAFTADEIIDLIFSVDGAVRNLEGTGLAVSTGTLAEIRKLKDGDDRFLLDYVAGGPSTVLGFPVFESPSMPAVATGEKPILFGHFPSVKVATTGLDVAVSPDYAFNEDVTTYRFLYRIAAAVANGDVHIKALEMA